MQDNEMEKAVDLLADSALRELGLPLVEPPDEYAEICDYAGCYPWLQECMNAHIEDETAFDALPGIVMEPGTIKVSDKEKDKNSSACFLLPP